MVTEGPIGERIRIYRMRRGISQKQLAELVGRSESWLSQVERGIRSVDRLSVLVDIARILKVDVETLSGHQLALAPNGLPELEGVEAIRSALSAYPALGYGSTPALVSIDEAQRLTAKVHERYQAADYGAASRILPGLIGTVDGVVGDSAGDSLRQALVAQCQVYIATAKLVTKIGDG